MHAFARHRAVIAHGAVSAFLCERKMSAAVHVGFSACSQPVPMFPAMPWLRVLPLAAEGFPMKANTTDSSMRVRRLCALAVFFALSYASVFVFRIHVLFLTFDIKDAIITIAAMMYGPIAGLAISAMDALLELTISETGLWGMIMNFISSAVFSFTAGLIYRYRRTLAGALTGLACAVVAMTGVMIGANLLITPLFLATDVAQVRAMIPSLLLPFNFTKALLNAGIVLLLYKRLSVLLHRLEHRPVQAEPAGNKHKGTVVTVCIACAVIAVALILFFVVLGGSVQLPFLSSGS